MAKRKTMSDYRELVRRLRAGQSIRAIQRETGTHRQIVRGIRDRARMQGWLALDRELPSEAELQSALGRGGAGGDKDTSDASSRKPHTLDVFRADFARWRNEGYTYHIIHQMIADRSTLSETTVRRYIQERLSHAAKPVLRRSTIPGEIMEVDFGSLGLVWDVHEKRNRKAHVFSARLRHSRRAYREIVFSQHQDVFFACHIHAFEFFGGVPEKVVMDNLKAAVIKAAVDDPIINRAYRDLAEYYGFLISPNRARTPRHNGGVENDMKYIKKNFWPLYREAERQRGHETPHAHEIQPALDRWNETVADVRVIRGVGRRPCDIFADEEAAALKALPPQRWDPVTWKQCKVGRDYRVQFEKAFYSVPYKHIGARVMVRGDSKNVVIFRDFQEIARHERARRPWQTLAKKEHAPPHHEEYLTLTSAGLRNQAKSVGPATSQVTENIFARRGIDGLRTARALVGFAKRFGPERLEAACEQAIFHDTGTYASVKNILVNKLDRIANEPQGQLSFRFARPAGYFDPAQEQHNAQF